MAKYLALIRRADFTDLFKYGSILLNRLTVVDYDSPTEVSKEDGILYRLFENANLFESSFTYVIVEFESPIFDFEKPVLNIEDVQNIYPLDMEAKRELETSFDEHIKISNPRWAQAYSIIQRIRTKKDSLKGANNICRLFNIEEDTQYIPSIITEDILDEVVNELYRNARPQGELSIWVYLLRYERHAFYPQETVGFFMDTVHVVCNYLRQAEVDETFVHNTAIVQTLEKLPRDAKMLDIFNYLLISDDAKNFISKVDEIESRVDFFKIAVIYLFLRGKYQDGLRYDSKMVSQFLSNEKTRDCFIFASYLLGLVLGHDKTYEALYENLPLKIYKSQEEMAAIRKQRDYERRLAALEMKRMEDEQQMQRFEKSKKSGKTQSNKVRSASQSISEGGRSNQRPFQDGFPRTYSEIVEKPVQISSLVEVTQPSPAAVENKDALKEVNDQESRTTVDNAVQTPVAANEAVEAPATEVKETSYTVDSVSEDTSEANVDSDGIHNAKDSNAEDAEDLTPQMTLFSNEDTRSEQGIPNFPIRMGKLGKGKGHPILKNPKPRKVNTIEEYQNLLDNGWRIIE